MATGEGFGGGFSNLAAHGKKESCAGGPGGPSPSNAPDQRAFSQGQRRRLQRGRGPSETVCDGATAAARGHFSRAGGGNVLGCGRIARWLRVPSYEFEWSCRNMPSDVPQASSSAMHPGIYIYLSPSSQPIWGAYGGPPAWTCSERLIFFFFSVIVRRDPRSPFWHGDAPFWCESPGSGAHRPSPSPLYISGDQASSQVAAAARTSRASSRLVSARATTVKAQLSLAGSNLSLSL